MFNNLKGAKLVDFVVYEALVFLAFFVFLAKGCVSSRTYVFDCRVPNSGCNILESIAMDT